MHIQAFIFISDGSIQFILVICDSLCQFDGAIKESLPIIVILSNEDIREIFGLEDVFILLIIKSFIEDSIDLGSQYLSHAVSKVTEWKQDIEIEEGKILFFLVNLIASSVEQTNKKF